MQNSLKRKKAIFFIVASMSPPVGADVIFDGDVNQKSSSESFSSYEGDIIVGDKDTSGDHMFPSGTLKIDNASEVYGSQSLYIGKGEASSGRFTIKEAWINVQNSFRVANGKGSYGEMNILDGAGIMASGSGSSIGGGAGSTGIVHVAGLNSVWRIPSGTLVVGENGTGRLYISPGSEVTTLTLRVANRSGSKGIINVDGGALKVWGSDSIGYAYVGVNGIAELNVFNGGTVTNKYTKIGGEGGVGIINVSDAGSSFLSHRFMTVGAEDNGTGLVAVENGGKIFIASYPPSPEGGSLIIGGAAGATGKVHITGLNSGIYAVNEKTIIGKAGRGNLILQKEGELESAGIVIAQQSGSTGVFDIGAPARLSAVSAGKLNPDATISFGEGEGRLNFNHTESEYLFANLIQGKGTVENNNGTTVLTAPNTWEGATKISGGILQAGTENTFSPNATYDVGSSGTLNINGYNQTIGSLTNAGKVIVSANQPGTTLKVNGNYIGNNGLLVFGTTLGGDDSISDRLLISGDTTGTSRVAVTNLGGNGAQTLNGIELITVGGKSSGEFVQQGRIVAGAFEYHLTRGKNDETSNWYLSNYKDDVGGSGSGGDNEGNGIDSGSNEAGSGSGGGNEGNGIDSGNNEDGVGSAGSGSNEGQNGDSDSGSHEGNIDGGVTESGEDNAGIDANKIQLLRPEGGVYSASLIAADTMFRSNLSDRLGETEYTDNITGEDKSTSLWIKNRGSHSRYTDKSGQLKTRSNSYTLLMGGDMARFNSDNGSSLRIGALAGYGYSHIRSGSILSGYSARGIVKGYTLGLYSTWFGDGSSEHGPYLDALLQYSWFNNTINGEGLSAEKYDSKGLNTTFETGYVIAMGNLGRHEELNWYVQPLISATWSGIRSDTHHESNGTEIRGDGNDNITTRLALKSFLKGHSTLDEGKQRNFKPFVETSWIHNTELRGITMDGVTVSQAGTRNIGELKLGVEGRIAPELNLTGYVSQKMGGKGYSESQAMLGLKYSF